MKQGFHKEQEEPNMFDEVVVKRNKDNTYKLSLSGYKTKGCTVRHDIVIYRLRDFPLEIEQTPICESSYGDFSLNQIRNWSLKIETQLLPNKRDAIYQIRTRTKSRRINNF